MRRLVVVTNIPTPYRVPLFNTLAPALAGAGWELEVVFGSAGNARRRWRIAEEELRFRHHYLGGRNLRLGPERILNTYAGLGPLLRERRPDGIVCTGYSPGTMAALRHARRTGTPLAIWSGTIPGDRERAFWRRLQRRWLVRRSDRFLAYGTAAREYLSALGADDDRIHIAWNTVDTEGFLSLRGPRAPTPREPLRLLSIGYLEAGKRIDLALRAVAAARAEGLDVALDVAGDGSRRPALERLAGELGLGDRVRFLGYQDYAAVKRCYEQAHVLVFPTECDIWGLVLVEAMAAGLVCLSSIRAGGTRDLVVDGETGFAVDYERTADVVARLRELAAERDRVAAMGERARTRIREHFTLQHSTEGWTGLVRHW